jgi:hypothetical protein
MGSDVDHDSTRPVVVYIAGSGRSGSTLLERTIGQMPGYVNVGEAVELFRTVLTKSLAGKPVQCGCGASVLECPFWTSVADRAFGGWDRDDVADIARRQRAVAAQRHLPKLLGLAPRDASFEADLAAYLEVYVRLYRAVLAESGAGVVVDASKWPGQGVALARSHDIDLRVLHLVRDVRGVSAAWAKAGVVKPTSGERRETMTTHNPLTTAARWSLFQLEVKALGARASRRTQVRYEDFVTAPGPEVTRALTALDTPVPAGGPAHVRDRTVHLDPSHGLAGNPSRFTHGAVRLRSDEDWRCQLSGSRRAGVAALGLPGLLACGYLPRGATR